MRTFEEVLRRWCDAEASGDVATLDALLDNDFLGDGPRGFVLGKQQWLDRHLGAGVEAVRWSLTRVWVNHQVAIGSLRSSRGESVCTLVAIRVGEYWSIVNLQVARSQPPG